ncbi:thioredoxin-dependent thiol peroxidase [Acuticoccus sp. M5D2P5]|uniref:thioredoxin-dependent thiol peroxidase n=1 Tax=Acuticoccus kalidii TaxID=2910977 RepID=UPI001F2CEECE|nr:thioredoxin-dependent thiol peroxidase [Acuticoccus kalidii]MCF3932521.1 thioredoxin-dependent thiol peroxidase [Acuticoccus kalidii]
MSDLVEGAHAPDFTVPGDNASEISLSALKGQPVVLYFYPKDNTTGCTNEANDFNALSDAFQKSNVAIIGVSPDSVASHDKFKAKLGLGYALAADTEHQVADAYGVWVEKQNYGRKYMGVERTTFLIDKDGRIARIWRKVKVAGHAESVLEAARAL